MKTAMIAMSGGVDSSVAAYLTVASGLSCIGGTLVLFEQPDNTCGSSQSILDSQKIAQRLGFPHHVFSMTDIFEEKVIDKFVKCYECGLTPNPCIDCNRFLKFDALLEKAISMGCDFLVTGHYAQIVQNPETGRYQLKKAADSQKDQTYFLYTLTQYQLSHILFPLGALTKCAVREIATQQNFINAKKQDSQDICFVPDGDYLSFLKRHTGKNYPSGNFLDSHGNIVGTHRGAVGYTLGQRKGLGVAMGTPVYVCQKDMVANTVTLGPNDALFHKALRANDWNFMPFETPDQPIRVTAKARSRMEAQPATLYPEKNGFARVEFDEPQRAITPGQAVVLYDKDFVIGGGTITEVL